MKKITIIQSSLREGSNTNTVCRRFAEICDEKWLQVTYMDLRNIEMDFCDGRDLKYYSKDLQKAYIKLEQQDVIIFWMPVYQYSMSGVLKNFIDICGGALKGKRVGAIVNAGGPNCYMASRDLFDCLFYEYACNGIMPTPYTWSMDFENGAIKNEKVLEKLEELAQKILSI